MERILRYIEFIEDVRQQSKVKHKLLDIVVIVLFAKLANADDWEEIADFAEYHEAFLKKYIELKNGIPSHDTIQRVFENINPDYIQFLYSKWNEMLNSGEGEKLKKIICIDGKTMRGNKVNDEKANHIVSAWSDEDGFCLGQKTVEEKSNEITAIPELLKAINIKGQVVTIDAMGTQTKIAETIKDRKADYVLALKENHLNLYKDVKDYFDDAEFCKKIKNKKNYKKTVEKAHSQIETREYYQTNDIKWLVDKEKWRGLKTIGMIVKTIKKNDYTVVEKRYYLSSLAPDIELFSKAVRQHWSVEIMHWHLDVTFKEDANTTLNKISAQNLNIINKWCLSILKTFSIARFERGKRRLSLRKKRFHISMGAEEYIAQIMNL